ncbi:conserved Plasmodium protein, unknown function [Plasmodium relictum]|uniref:Uncharacterized protein n=1 Tax=Plasmodium relictum TaxID=85471 RepID=A0A1J1HEQ1_PLARL|nr:conserved Plasmodium protein, unknown function [Plasmodium relictum]CRH03888.1 conserved Plasmodium protein, unknown function [Plasmodium relictum]
MNIKEDQKLFNEKLCGELRKLRGYKIIQNVFRVKKKKKEKKKGLLYNLIELKYVNKILYQLYFHKKCMKKFINGDNLLCYTNKIIQIKKDRNIIVNFTDTNIEASFHFINCDKNFYIFCKINHYVNNELFNCNSTSSIILFLYESNYNKNKTFSKYLNNSSKLNITDKHLSKYLRKNNFFNEIIKDTPTTNTNNSNKKYNIENKYSLKNRTSVNKKISERNISTKKIVDHYLLLINYYVSYNKILHFSFFHTLQKILYKFLNDKNLYKKIYNYNRNDNRGCDKIINLTNASDYHKFNNYEFTFESGRNVNHSKNKVEYDTIKDIKLKTLHFIKEKRKFSYFLYIFCNKCNSTKKVNNSLINIKRSLKKITLSLEKNNKIYIYSNVLKKEKEFFLTFNNINKCFFIFISPILLYFNNKNYIFLKINTNIKNEINIHLILEFMNELFLLIREMYLKKKLIKKLKKYISNRTLKGYLNYNSFNRHRNEKREKKKYIYTFHSILDNFFLVQENYHINNKLFLKIKKLFVKINPLNKNVILNFIQKKFEKLCVTAEELLKWNWKFRNVILSKKEHMYIYFLEKKEYKKIINKDENFVNNIGNNNYCIKSNSNNDIILYNNNCNRLNHRNKEIFNLICVFKIVSIKDKILKLTKNICIYFTHFFNKFEKFNIFDKIYILKHFHFIINKFPYLYIFYMESKKCIFLFYRNFIQCSNMLSIKKSLKDKYNNLLKLKKKKKKLLKKVFFNEETFFFLLKMQKLLLYFYLYLLRKFFRFSLKKNKMQNKFSCTRETIYGNFGTFIKKIKKEKEKIYIYFLNNESILLNYENNSSKSRKACNSFKKKEKEKKKLIFISKIICIEKYLVKKKEKRMELLDKNSLHHNEVNFNKNNINKMIEKVELKIEINEKFEKKNGNKNLGIKDENLYNFFKLKNMKKTVCKYLSYLIEKTKEKIKKDENVFYLNVNLHKLKLLKIVNQLQIEIKTIMEYIYKMNDNNEININNNRKRNEGLNFIDYQKIDKLLLFINKKIKINKNLRIFNISNEILKKKMDFTKLIKINDKVIHNLVLYEKQSFDKIFKKNKLLSYKMTLNYLIFFINGHISYSANIFTNDYEKLNKSYNIYFVNIYKNDIIKNKFIEDTMYFLENIFAYISDIATFIKNINVNKKKRFSFNIRKIFCYEILQNKGVVRKIYKGKKKGDFFLNIFIFFKEKILFFHSYKKYDKNNNLFNPFFVKILNQNKYYDVFLDSTNSRTDKN